MRPLTPVHRSTCMPRSPSHLDYCTQLCLSAAALPIPSSCIPPFSRAPTAASVTYPLYTAICALLLCSLPYRSFSTSSKNFTMRVWMFTLELITSSRSCASSVSSLARSTSPDSRSTCCERRHTAGKAAFWHQAASML
eukprot:GHRQ01026375.1.p1 GENE.GHRQ01026375.1~~GHRQ01026375.1.p1  ORF type:complete len:138 (-),score=13.17 GHRQ01026375.1:152-565(-)